MIWRELVEARSSHLLAEITIRSALWLYTESAYVLSVAARTIAELNNAVKAMTVVFMNLAGQSIIGVLIYVITSLRGIGIRISPMTYGAHSYGL